MTTRTNTTKLMAALAVVSLAAAACGSDEPDAVEDQPATTEATADEAMEDDTMDEGAMEEPATSEAMEDDAMDEETMEDDAMDEGTMEDDAMEDAAMDEAAGPTGELCAAVPEDGEGSFAGMTDDPAATAASNNPALSTLVAAVTEAGLVDTLNGDGPFTIFAPANPAFEALGDDTVNAVLADQELLTSILTLHVVAGEQLSGADLAGLDSVETVNGQEITLSVEGDALMVNGQATVGCADVQTANATVHIIDAVLMPS